MMPALDRSSDISKQLHSETDKILVVGGRSTNFSQDLREHKQVIFWDSTDPATHNKSKIPEGVRVIVFTRFIDHSLQTAIKNMAPPDVLVLPRLYGTGKIKKILRQALPAPKELSVAVPVNMEGTAVMTKDYPRCVHGELIRFVKANADLDAADRQEELKRLLKLAIERKLPTTASSIENAYYRLRKRRTKQEPVQAASSLELPGAAAAAVLDSETSSAAAPPEAHIRDSFEILKEFLEQIQLAALALEDLLKEFGRLREMEKEFLKLKQAITPFLNHLKKAVN